MRKNMLTAHCDYGFVRNGNDYEVVGEGDDWYLVKFRGTSMYVFKWIF